MSRNFDRNADRFVTLPAFERFIAKLTAQIKGEDPPETQAGSLDGPYITLSALARAADKVKELAAEHGAGSSADSIIRDDYTLEINENTTSIVFTDEKAGDGAVDISQQNDGTVKKWFDGTTCYVTSGVKDKPIYVESAKTGMFKDLSPITEFDLKNLDTSLCTNMSYMFSGCSGVAVLDLSNFVVDSIEPQGISHMFENCKNLQTIYAYDWADNGNASGSLGVFIGCLNTKLKGGSGSNFVPFATTGACCKDAGGGYFTNPSKKPTE